MSRARTSLPGVIAVVVTHNRPDDLKAVVTALLRQSCLPDHIFVMDNASNRPAREVLSPNARLTVCRSAVNCGGAGGFSWGIQTALGRPGQWIWLMDDDAVPDTDALRQLLLAAESPLVRQSPVGSLSAAVYEFGDLALQHRRRFHASWGREVPLARDRYDQGPQRIDTTSFVGCLIAADAIRAAGLPDAQLFLSYDDTEYSLRLAHVGRQHWLVPASKIDHRRQPAGRLSRSPFGGRHYYNIRNRIVVCRRYATHPILAGFYASLLGLALCLRSGAGHRWASMKGLVAALVDGWSERLGMLRPHVER